ncbi:hypothetical protein [Megalodesulfovibrio paquesii]
MCNWKAKGKLFQAKYKPLGVMFMRFFVRQGILIPATCLLVGYFGNAVLKKVVEVIFLINAVVGLVFIVYYIAKLIIIAIEVLMFNE